MASGWLPRSTRSSPILAPPTWPPASPRRSPARRAARGASGSSPTASGGRGDGWQRIRRRRGFPTACSWWWSMSAVVVASPISRSSAIRLVLSVRSSACRWNSRCGSRGPGSTRPRRRRPRSSSTMRSWRRCRWWSRRAASPPARWRFIRLGRECSAAASRCPPTPSPRTTPCSSCSTSSRGSASWSSRLPASSRSMIRAYSSARRSTARARRWPRRGGLRTTRLGTTLPVAPTSPAASMWW